MGKIRKAVKTKCPLGSDRQRGLADEITAAKAEIGIATANIRDRWTHWLAGEWSRMPGQIDPVFSGPRVATGHT